VIYTLPQVLVQKKHENHESTNVAQILMIYL